MKQLVEASIRLSSTLASMCGSANANTSGSVDPDDRSLHALVDLEQHFPLAVQSTCAICVDGCPDWSLNGEGMVRQHRVHLSVDLDVSEEMGLVQYLQRHSAVGLLEGRVAMNSEMRQRVG